MLCQLKTQLAKYKNFHLGSSKFGSQDLFFQGIQLPHRAPFVPGPCRGYRAAKTLETAASNSFFWPHEHIKLTFQQMNAITTIDLTGNTPVEYIDLTWEPPVDPPAPEPEVCAISGEVLSEVDTFCLDTCQHEFYCFALRDWVKYCQDHHQKPNCPLCRRVFPRWEWLAILRNARLLAQDNIAVHLYINH